MHKEDAPSKELGDHDLVSISWAEYLYFDGFIEILKALVANTYKTNV